MAGKKLMINTAWCKGCVICAAFCPREVLAIAGGKVAAAKMEQCIHCGLCEQRCPDYAIYIDKEEEAAG